MKSIKLHIWRLFLANFPSYKLKNFFCNYILGHKISETASIHLGVYLTSCYGLTIGDNSTINRNCLLDSRGGLYIGANVSISPDVHIITAGHDLDSSDFTLVESAVEISDYAWLGSRSTILPGVKIGYGAVVAAGAVVTKNVGNYEVVGGVPAKLIKTRSSLMKYSPKWRPWFS